MVEITFSQTGSANFSKNISRLLNRELLSRENSNVSRARSGCMYHFVQHVMQTSAPIPQILFEQKVGLGKPFRANAAGSHAFYKDNRVSGRLKN
jgi:hypothetical protein